MKQASSAFRLHPSAFRREVMRERGFTLLEMMTAVFIVALLMTFLLTIHVGTMRVRRRTEQVTEMNAGARAAFDLLRRDLQGAFPLAERLVPDTESDSPYYVFNVGEEFQWQAGNPANGFRRLSFVTAMDGSRTTIKDSGGTDIDPFRLCEHAAVSWSVRGGALFRQTCQVKMSITSSDTPAGWLFNPPGPGGTGDGVQVGAGNEAYTDITATFTLIDTYRGMPYIMTANSDAQSDTVPSSNMYFEMDNDGTMEPVPVNVVVCFPESRTEPLPHWTRKFRRLETGGAPRIVRAGGVDYCLYSKACPEARVHLGPNEGSIGGRMYFVILEPLWWSLGEDAEDLVFRPSYAPTDDDSDGIYTGGVPEYVDVTLTIADPDSPDPLLRSRRFGERIWIPAGGGQ